MDCGVRTVQRWEQSGLPIMRPTGNHRAHVLAESEQLDQWVRKLRERKSLSFIPKDLIANIEQTRCLRVESKQVRAESKQARQSLRLQLDVLRRGVAALRLMQRRAEVRTAAQG